MRSAIHVLVAAAVGLCIGSAAGAQPVPVELVQAEGGGWQLLRGDEPYFVQGAGGENTAEALDRLVEAGGNSIRTWAATDRVQATLDRAHARGLTVTVGLWLPHNPERYADAEWVAQRKEKARQAVLKYKDHPALLIWAVGNEMERPDHPQGDAIWTAVNDIAAMIHDLDADHPTMTVIAELGKDDIKVHDIQRLCPEVDIVGVNSYAMASTVAQRYREAGGKRPYMITEFGQRGAWGTAKNVLGTKPELTSTQKSRWYRKTYQGSILPEKGRLCLGSYAFNWGLFRETTWPTWFGTRLPNGDKLAAEDVLTELWFGSPPANRCPTITPIALDGSDQVRAGGTVRASVIAADPEGDAVEVTWALVETSTAYPKGGAKAAEAQGAVIDSDGHGGAIITMPEKTGLYRLYAFGRDGKGAAAMANIPLLVGPIEIVPLKPPYGH